MESRNLLLARLQELCSWAVPGSTVLPSARPHASCTRGADLDLTLILALVRDRTEQHALVRHLAEAFRQFQPGELAQIKAVDRAGQSRLRDASSGLQCDLSIGNDVGVHKTRSACFAVAGPPRPASLPHRGSRGQASRPGLSRCAACRWCLVSWRAQLVRVGAPRDPLPAERPSPPVLPWLHRTRCCATALRRRTQYAVPGRALAGLLRVCRSPFAFSTDVHRHRQLHSLQPGRGQAAHCLRALHPRPRVAWEDLGRQLTPETMTAPCRQLAQTSASCSLAPRWLWQRWVSYGYAEDLFIVHGPP